MANRRDVDVRHGPSHRETGEHAARRTRFDAAALLTLTGRTPDGNPIAPSSDERNKYWATTFRALGDAVHLIEDMAQPQHTRNEPSPRAALRGRSPA